MVNFFHIYVQLHAYPIFAVCLDNTNKKVNLHLFSPRPVKEKIQIVSQEFSRNGKELFANNLKVHLMKRKTSGLSFSQVIFL